MTFSKWTQYGSKDRPLSKGMAVDANLVQVSVQATLLAAPHPGQTDLAVQRLAIAMLGIARANEDSRFRKAA